MSQSMELTKFYFKTNYFTQCQITLKINSTRKTFMYNFGNYLKFTNNNHYSADERRFMGR